MKKLLGLVSIVAFSTLASLGRGEFHQGDPTEQIASAKFTAIVLGTAGGLHEDNLSAYLLAPIGSTDFIALDAGTLLVGIHKADRLGSLWDIGVPPASKVTRESWVLQHHIKAYLLTHAHLDHVAGLLINAPDDAKKEIIGLPATIDFLRDHLFNWKIWPNFADEGESPPLNKYRYVRVNAGQAYPIAGTAMQVEPFLLSHSGSASTAFLIQSGGFYALYFGDTGPDVVEKSDSMKTIWTRVAPLARSQKLRGIFLEVSYPDGRPDDLLFGHLTPSWMMEELHQFAQLVDPENPPQAFSNLTVIVTHIKPASQRGPTPRDQIVQQLEGRNTLGIRFIIAQQGRRIEF